MSETIPPPAPEEMVTDRLGRQVPARLYPARIRLENQAVQALIEKARTIQALLAEFKAEAMQDVEALMDILAASHGVKRTGRRGGVQLNSIDTLMRVEISVADGHTFGPELSLAKEKIDACITGWSEGTPTELQQMVEAAFKVGKTGQVSTDRILALRRVNSENLEWLEAMRLIDDALRVMSSKAYIRFYARPNTEADFQQIVLDASRL